MSTNLTDRRSGTTVLLAVLAVLVAAEIIVLLSDLSSGVRYGVSAVIALGLVVSAVQLGRGRR